MCGYPNEIRPSPGLRKRNAAIMLAILLNDRLGVVVLPSQVRELLTEDWDRVSALAHEIHGSGPADKPDGKTTATG